MIKFYLYKLNFKFYCFTSYIPTIVMYMCFTIYLLRKNNINIYKTNYSFNNISNMVVELVKKSIFKNFINPTESFMLKWNIGFAIFIYLLIIII